MSEVKQYDAFDGYGTPLHGKFVRHDDYAALEAECERLRQEIGRKSVITGDYIARCQRLADERDQLRAEAEALRQDAGRWSKCKTMPKAWWLEAMDEASRKGGRSLDEQIDTAMAAKELRR